MPDIPASAEERKALERRHKRFLSGESVERDGVRDFVLDSWLRCRELFSRRSGPVFHVLPERELEDRRKLNAAILTHAAPVMHSVFELFDGPEAGIKGVDCCVFVTDRDGVLLAKLDNHPFPLRVGMSMEEKLIGTNSVYSCIENRYISTVYGFEHYFGDFSEHVASSAPIITEDGVVHGAFGVLLHCRGYDLSVKVVSDIAAKAISSLVNAEVHRSYRSFLLDYIEDAVIYIDKSRHVLSFNRMASETFPGIRAGAELTSVIPFTPDFGERLGEGKDLTFFATLRGHPRRGTAFYTTLNHDHLGGAVLILRRARKIRELAAYVATPGALYSFEDIMGESRALRRTVELARKASSGDMTTLITGESGTGKELFAHAMHNAGARARQPFIIVNCGALPQGLIQSELFGYEEGSFTGASLRGKVGKFELADGGTIFLDEVGELPLDVQANLLRFLQSGELSKIGSARPRRVDVRVIAATNRDLPELIRRGRFRQDLFYRLNVFPLHIPALREREGDVVLLARHFARVFSRAARGRDIPLSKESLDNLAAHDWPGNVRELENCIRLHVNLAEGDVISVPPFSVSREGETFAEGFAGRKDSFERKLLAEALENNGGNIRRAASFLGMPLSTMYAKIKKYNLLPGRLKASSTLPDSPERDREIAQLISRLAPESKESLYHFLKSLV